MFKFQAVTLGNDPFQVRTHDVGQSRAARVGNVTNLPDQVVVKCCEIVILMNRS